MYTDYLTQCLWEFEESRDETRLNNIHESNTAFRLVDLTDKSKIGVFVPNILCQKHKERIWI